MQPFNLPMRATAETARGHAGYTKDQFERFKVREVRC